VVPRIVDIVASTAIAAVRSVAFIVVRVAVLAVSRNLVAIVGAIALTEDVSLH